LHQEWLADCSDWLASDLGLDPSSDFDQFIQHVEAQLLQSNLADSTVPGSGIDPLLVAPTPTRLAPDHPSRQPSRSETRRHSSSKSRASLKSRTLHSAF
jgi:hypothetical protein